MGIEAGIKSATNTLKFHSEFPVEEDTIRLQRKRQETTYRQITQTDIMKSCTKVVVAFFVLCAIHACLAKPKWLWLNEDVVDDLELEANDGQDRRFKNAKRKMSVRKGCDKCKASNCYDNICIE